MQPAVPLPRTRATASGLRARLARPWRAAAGLFWRLNAAPVREVHRSDLELLLRSTHD